MKKLVLILTVVVMLALAVGCGAKEVLDRSEERIEEAVKEDLPEGLMPKEAAEDIAIAHVKLTREQVQNIRTEYEFENGMHKYEIEFSSEDWEYEFEVHAELGTVLSYDKELLWG